MKQKSLFVYAVAGIFALLVGCVNADGGVDTSADPLGRTDKASNLFETFPKGEQIKVATYNVLNLFDAEHDEGKDDYTFLPSNYPGKQDYCQKLSSYYYKKECLETDWSDAGVDLKLGQIREVFSLQGALPDLLAVEEIENENVTRRMAAVLGFENYLVTNSPDARGIDVALLYSNRMLEYLEHKEIVLQGKGLPASFETKPTRNILRVDFRVKNRAASRLTVYVNHWPSQAAGPDKRVAVAQILRKDIEAHVTGPDHSVIVMGDFNTLTNETPNAFHNVIQDPNWKGALLDSQELSRQAKSSPTQMMPYNSYYYGGNNSWEKLDRILVSQNLNNGEGPELLANTFRIVAHDTLLEPFENKDSKSFYFGVKLPKVPRRYNPATTVKSELGYSDHLPVTVLVQF